MPRQARKTAQIFGSNAGANQLAVIGSIAAGSPQYSSDPAVIQSLANYLSGWFNVAVGQNSPAIEDMNSLCYLFAYQISYIMQLGLAEWDSATTYYIGSLAQDGSGNIYTSLQNNNLNQALTNAAYWRAVTAGVNVVAVNPTTTPTLSLAATDNGKTFLVNSANGPITINLPAPANNFTVRIKDVGGQANTNAITIHRYGTELFELIQTDYIYMANNGTITIISDGTNWYKL